ncbi:MAG: winged helix-turn-helix transcriptional regulator [Alkaliphilus sp.]
MERNKYAHSYNEYFIMTEILDDENVSQRKLSKKLGLGLGTVNVLVNKMIKEGLIKMEQVSQKQVVYMLTPAGMMEKTKKTISYIKSHYRAIHENKEKIKTILGELNLKHENIYILKPDDEMGNLIEVAAAEYKAENKEQNVKIVNESFEYELTKLQATNNSVLIYASENEEMVKSLVETSNIAMVNLLERL